MSRVQPADPPSLATVIPLPSPLCPSARQFFVNVLCGVCVRAYDLYSFNMIPLMGQAVANDRQSYQYLVESIRKFPNQEAFATIIRDAGFKAVSYENLTFGVCSIHSGFKL